MAERFDSMINTVISLLMRSDGHRINFTTSSMAIRRELFCAVYRGLYKEASREILIVYQEDETNYFISVTHPDGRRSYVTTMDENIP